jgi:hypothetical protein
MNKIILSILLLPVLSLASTNQENFEFFKDIKNVDGAGIYKIVLDKDIESKSKNYFSDIRIYNAKNKEVKYIFRKERDEIQRNDRQVSLNFEEIGEQEFIIDLGNDIKGEYLNNIMIGTNSRSFRVVADVYGADVKEGPYFKLNIDGKRGDLIYDTPIGRDFNLNFKYSNYKYLKIKFSGSSDDLLIQNFFRIKEDSQYKEGKKMSVKIYGINKFIDEEHQSILLDVKKDNLFFDDLKLSFNDKSFNRRYVLYASDDKNAEILKDHSRFNPKKHYWVKISSGNLIKEEYYDEVSLTLRSDKRYYRLDIDNTDNENLDFEYAVLSKFQNNIYFMLNGDTENLRIFYGSPKVTSPKYDFKLDYDQIKNSKTVILAEEQKNENYKKDKNNLFDNK